MTTLLLVQNCLSILDCFLPPLIFQPFFVSRIFAALVGDRGGGVGHCGQRKWVFRWEWRRWSHALHLPLLWETFQRQQAFNMMTGRPPPETFHWMLKDASHTLILFAWLCPPARTVVAVFDSVGISETCPCQCFQTGSLYFSSLAWSRFCLCLLL